MKEERYKPNIEIGLTNEQVQQRKTENLVNHNHEVPTKSIKQILQENFITLFNILNLILGFLIFATGSYKNMTFLLIAIINTAISTIQEIHSKRVIDKLSILAQSKAKVIRDGKKQEIDIEEIVLDDIVIFQTGDQIATDSIVQEGEVEVDESFITGEPNAITKTKGEMLLSGSFIVSGICKAKVEHVGEENYTAQISKGAKYVKKVKSEIMISLNKIIRILSIAIIPIGLILFWNQLQVPEATVKEAILKSVAAIIGMIPEGLVLLTSTVLAVSVIRLSRRKVLVQELYSIESLAHIDTICLDKTGTITKGKMRVSEIKTYNETILPKPFKDMMIAFVNGMDDNNATFHAFKKYFQGDISYEISDKVAFSSERKWSSISFKNEGSIIVGAPERLFDKSNMEVPKEINELQKDGKRVLGIAYTKSIIDEPELPELEVIAIAILEDPLRKNAKEILKYFKDQGIDVKIISGDNSLTVSNIAKKAGLEDYESYIDLSTIKTDAELVDLVDKYSIFARVLPHQKSIIVKALQAKGHKVAMTGDGVNDVIALRESDCSITLPEATDSAKQVSQIVLLNSDFSVLKDVLMEGRRVVNNITKVARIFFIKTIYSILLSIFCIITNMEFPFIPIQITLVDLVIEAYTSFFITFEQNKKPVTGAFLMTALTNALPFALVIMFNIIFLTFLGDTLTISQTSATTIMYLLIGFVSILAVQEVCKPYTKVHLFLFLTTAVGFYVAVILFRNLLHISLDLQNNEIVITIILAVISYLFISIKRTIYRRKNIGLTN